MLLIILQFVTSFCSGSKVDFYRITSFLFYKIASKVERISSEYIPVLQK